MNVKFWLCGVLFCLLATISLSGCAGDTAGVTDNGVILCGSDNDCPVGMFCNDGICDSLTDGGQGCTSDQDCAPGYKCDLPSGDCILETDGGEEPSDGGDEQADGGDPGGEEGSECAVDELRECGPGTKVGECDIGVEYCVNGYWSGVCEGAVYPEDEKCDGLDNDCDGNTPADEIDQDGDEFSACQGDCDEEDSDVNPDATEIYCNDTDDDCNAETPDDIDADQDGFSVCLGDCDDETKRLFGTLVVTGFEQAALSRARAPYAARKPFFLYVDEFQDFACHPGAAETFSQMLSQVRKFGLHMILANQSIAQLSSGLQTALGNAQTIVTFRISRADAEALARVLGEVNTQAVKHDNQTQVQHPVYSPLSEQWEEFVNFLTKQKVRQATVKTADDRLVVIWSELIKENNCPPDKLEDVITQCLSHHGLPYQTVFDVLVTKQSHQPENAFYSH